MLFQSMQEENEKKTHLNAIFIALSWNISVNLLVVFRVACVHYERVHMLPLYLFALLLALKSQHMLALDWHCIFD